MIQPKTLQCGSLALVLTLGLIACQSEEEIPLSPRSDVVVVLPPTPDLTPPVVKLAHRDGVLTVAGVAAARSQNLEQNITVRGDVVSTHTCVEPTDGGKPCHPPTHFVIWDGPDAEHRLVVIGQTVEQVQALVVGQELTLTGRFVMISPDGRFIRQAGILVLTEQ
ncbi:MAG: hypothetical protein VX938_11450 [Myxococcota bacterium]|nr:hypothetical protein [Myxococcota bacterium]